MKKLTVTILVTCLLLSTSPISITGKDTNCESLSYLSTDEFSLSSEFVDGELIVKFKDDINVNLISPEGKIQNTGIQSIDNLIKEYDVKSGERLVDDASLASLSNIYKITLGNYEDSADVLAAVEDYGANPFVEFAEPNYIGFYCGIPDGVEESHDLQEDNLDGYHFEKSKAAIVPNDPNFCLQWGLHNIGQTGGIPDADIDAPEAWDLEKGNGEVVIAVIDSGVDYTHPDLADNIWENDDEIPCNGFDDDKNGFVDDIIGWDFLDGDNDPRDYFGHGTHCAGIVAAVTNNGEGIAGVCWHCKIMSIRTCHYKDEPVFYVAKGVIYATKNGADIISMSLGWIDTSWVLHFAIDYAYNNGVIIVAAAGNAGHYGFPILTFPGRHNLVIGVGAINHLGELYYKSSWGPSLDIVAPGEDVYSTLPTYHVLFNDFGLNQSYDNLSGTSMACPHVAGVAALVLSHNSSLKNYEVMDILQSTAEDLGNEGKDWYFGYGLVNAYRAVEKSSDYKLQNNNNYEIELGQNSYSQQFTQNQCNNI